MESTPQLPPRSAGTNNSCQVLPPMSIGRGNLDRAWNDPPLFSLEVNGMAKPVPTKLNKRVAYPGLSSTTPSLPQGSTTGGSVITASEIMSRPPPTILPPTKVDFIPSFPSPGSTPEELSSSNSSTPGNDIKVTLPQQVEGDISPEAGIQSVLTPSKSHLMKLLTTALNEGVDLEPSVEAEVRKRLEILDSKWDSLPSEVREKLIELGKFMEARDFKTADTIQLSLGYQFMTHCGPWIMALKQIIRKNLPLN